ncbi:MAG: hypothetical protein AAF715_14350 [Myxococcota bacterium]
MTPLSAHQPITVAPNGVWSSSLAQLSLAGALAALHAILPQRALAAVAPGREAVWLAAVIGLGPFLAVWGVRFAARRPPSPRMRLVLLVAFALVLATVDRAPAPWLVVGLVLVARWLGNVLEQDLDHASLTALDFDDRYVRGAQIGRIGGGVFGPLAAVVASHPVGALAALFAGAATTLPAAWRVPPRRPPADEVAVGPPLAAAERRLVAWSLLLCGALLLLAGDMLYVLRDRIGFRNPALAVASGMAIIHVVAAAWVAKGPAEPRAEGRIGLRFAMPLLVAGLSASMFVAPPSWSLLVVGAIGLGLAFGVWAGDTRGWAAQADRELGGGRRIETSTNIVNYAGLLAGCVLALGALLQRVAGASPHDVAIGGAIALAVAAGLAALQTRGGRA